MRHNSDSLGGSSHELRLPLRYRLVAIMGVALIALSLNGSARIAAKTNLQLASPPSPETRRLKAAAVRLASAGRYLEARDAFYELARTASRQGEKGAAALALSSAGACSLNRLEFQRALEDFLRAKKMAEAARDWRSLGVTLNNLASLYNQMGDSLAALQVAREAPTTIDPSVAARIRYQMAHALAALGRLGQAEPLYRSSIGEFETRGDFDNSTKIRGNFGADLIAAGRDAEAESILTEGVLLRRQQQLPALSILLRGLALIHSHKEQPDTEALFQAALDAGGLAPRWNLFADRGDYRLNKGDTAGALDDFRNARRLALELRADVLPVDQDRIAFESSLGQVLAGLVDAGNRIARQSGSETLSGRNLIEETFDAAEEDRLWSLRALVPSPDDWRSHLPPRYWDVLARYRAGATNLRAELDELESHAAALSQDGRLESEPPLRHLRKALKADATDEDSVLFSFHVSAREGWLWAVDEKSTAVYRIPARRQLEAEVATFVAALRRRDSRAEQLGAQLYRELFGAAAPGYLKHGRWLLELDGPLFDLPFAALVPVFPVGKPDFAPRYLAETRILEAVPSALLFGAQDTPPAAGGFVGIGDPIYNSADSRYQGDRSQGAAAVGLPRLPATAGELARCSREWGAPQSVILTGASASSGGLESALRAQPDIIHFATHVVSSRDEGGAGLIALSLDPQGRPRLLGPAEIVSHPVRAHLVILDGCHSAAGAALPASGLLGLTRSWLGAGAHSVLATRWEVGDNDAPDFMVEFYRHLRRRGSSHAAEAFADAEMGLLANPAFRAKTDFWPAYFVLGRQ